MRRPERNGLGDGDGDWEGWERQKCAPSDFEEERNGVNSRYSNGYLEQTRYVRQKKNKKEGQETAVHSSILFALYATYVDDFQKILR